MIGEDNREKTLHLTSSKKIMSKKHILRTVQRSVKFLMKSNQKVNTTFALQSRLLALKSYYPSVTKPKSRVQTLLN